MTNVCWRKARDTIQMCLLCARQPGVSPDMLHKLKAQCQSALRSELNALFKLDKVSRRFV